MGIQTQYNVKVISGNTVGTSVAVTGAGPSTAAGKPGAQGLLHSFCLNDSGAAALTIYDSANAAAGNIVFQATLPSGGGTIPMPSYDALFNIGLFVVISGGTAPLLSMTWA